MGVTVFFSEECKREYHQIGNSVHAKMYRKAVSILISVVIGAILLAGLYALFGEVVLPTLNERIIDMFDFAG